MPTETDGRFDSPLYTIPEAARFLGVSASTFTAWTKDYACLSGDGPVACEPIVTSVEAARGHPSIPFIGLVEGVVLAAFHRRGASLHHIRRAARLIQEDIGAHALASERLYTDGARILYGDGALAVLTQVAPRQRVFGPTIRDSIERIEYAEDGWAARLISPATARPLVVADPGRSFGQPIFVRGAIRVEDVLDRWRAGDPLAEVADDFGVALEDVGDVLRVATA